jgi:hypothetical protein
LRTKNNEERYKVSNWGYFYKNLCKPKSSRLHNT